MMQLTTTPEELLSVIKEMFPTEYDRAIAELTIRKLSAENQRLTEALAMRESGAEGEQAA